MMRAIGEDFQDKRTRNVYNTWTTQMRALALEKRSTTEFVFVCYIGLRSKQMD